MSEVRAIARVNSIANVQARHVLKPKTAMRVNLCLKPVLGVRASGQMKSIGHVRAKKGANPI